ncbi:MAG TPA: DUF4440 domain-containing protein [Candidatus Acidoferrales bacterium]|nr:DUF4440 domain-containing protein [Candidatus Acidoferrales bacterium]
MLRLDKLGFLLAHASVLGPFLSFTGGEATDERAIRELDTAWSSALQNRDLEKAMSNYADDAVFLPPDAPLVEGRGRISEWFAQRMSTPGYSPRFTPTRIVVAKSRDMAYELGTFSVTSTTSAVSE